MKLHSTLASYGVALAVLFAVAMARAAESPSSPCDPSREVERISRFGYARALSQIVACLGTENDVSKAAFIQASNKLSKSDEGLATRVPKVRDIAAMMRGYADARATVAPSAADRQVWGSLIQALEYEQGLLEQSVESFDAATRGKWKLKVFSPSLWQVTNEGVAGVHIGVSLTTDIDTSACSQTPTSADDCIPYVSRRELIRVLNAGYRLNKYLVRDEFDATTKRVALRDAQWTQYHDESLFQWPWELAYNGYQMKRSKSSLCEYDENGMQQGYCRVPSSQTILLHPDVAFQWVNGTAGSSDLHAAAYVEVFGRYSWTWSDAGAINRPKGWSVIAVYSNLEEQADVGYGLMYHGRRANSIALTVTDGRIGLLVSIAVADRFFAASNASRDKLSQILKSPD